jgi:hypothetical protein
MILLAYRHGFRASELCDLQWSQVELATGWHTSAGQRTAHRVSTRCRVTRYAPCGACNTSKGHPRLANPGHDTRALQAWLRHKNIQHTVRYTELARIGSSISGDSAPRDPTRFRTFQVCPKDLAAHPWQAEAAENRLPGNAHSASGESPCSTRSGVSYCTAPIGPVSSLLL